MLSWVWYNFGRLSWAPTINQGTSPPLDPCALQCTSLFVLVWLVHVSRNCPTSLYRCSPDIEPNVLHDLHIPTKCSDKWLVHVWCMCPQNVDRSATHIGSSLKTKISRDVSTFHHMMVVAFEFAALSCINGIGATAVVTLGWAKIDKMLQVRTGKVIT